MTGVTRFDRVRNEVVRRSVGMERELVSRVDQRVLRLFGHMERTDKQFMVKRVLGPIGIGNRLHGRV